MMPAGAGFVRFGKMKKRKRVNSVDLIDLRLVLREAFSMSRGDGQGMDKEWDTRTKLST